MKKTTKIISLLLTIAMMVTMAVPMTVSATFTDVPTTHHYYNAINNLSAEGILNGFEDGSFKPGDPVTRAQFTKIICFARAVGNLTYSEAERSIFTDVAPDHWAANNIVTAYNQKIINGMGDGTFAPEAGVNYEQAVKMVVCALGYAPERAEALGGYPGGYMSLANSAKILAGITDAKMGEVMNRGAVAQLIDNMMDANQISEGQLSGSIRDEISTSKSVEGRVVAGHDFNLYSYRSESCNKNEILVDSYGEIVEFDISEIKFDINKYIGRSVVVYYDEESGSSVDVATSITLQPRKNQEITIDLEDIYSYNDTYIEYYVDEDLIDTEKFYYETDCDKFLNGEATDDSIFDILKRDGNEYKAGEITLVCSGNDDTADLAIIKTYNTLIVNNVDTKNKKVYGKNDPYTTGKELDVDSRNINVTIQQNGSDFELSSIRENDILLISESSKSIEVLVSRNTKSGTIVSKTADNKIKLSTGDAIYTLSADAMFEGGTKDEVKAGKYITAYFDAFGKIAKIVFKAETSYSFGYLAALEEGTMTRPEIRIMLYKASASNTKLTGEEKTFANKIRVNGELYNVDDEMDDILAILATTKDNASDFDTAVAPTNIDYSQPIRYTLNTSGEINAILTKAATGEFSMSLNLKNYIGEGAEILCSVGGSTLGTHKLTSSTPIIYVPTDRANGTYYSKTNSFFNQDETYFVQFANASTSGTVQCVYLYGGGSGDITASITKDTMPMIITSKSDVVLDGEDTEREKLEVINIATGETGSYYEDELALPSTLAIGDVVRIAATSEGYIEKIEVIADASDVIAKTTASDKLVVSQGSDKDTINAEFRTLIGTVKSKTNDNRNFSIVKGFDGAADGAEPYSVSDTTPIYLINLTQNDANKVTTATSGAFGSYTTDGADSTIMILTSRAQLKAIIIFGN